MIPYLVAPGGFSAGPASANTKGLFRKALMNFSRSRTASPTSAHIDLTELGRELAE
jgi:hypothetical protein